MKLGRTSLLAFCLLLLSSTGIPGAAAAGPTNKTSEDLAQVDFQIQWTVNSPQFDRPHVAPDSRNKQLRPLRLKKIELLRQIQLADPRTREWAEFHVDAQLAHLSGEGDSTSRKTLEQSASSSDPVIASMGKLGLTMADWWSEPTPDAQTKVLAGLLDQAHAHPADQWLAYTLVSVADNGASDTALGITARTTVARDMTSKYARTYAATPNKVNWPLVVSGTTVQGKSFTTAAWKGKVVMVDFWATWCPPCIAELPSVVATYKKYHDQGFEIIGVSNDFQRQDLLQFLSRDPGVAWPQLFAPSSSASHWNVLTEKYGVDSIPRVYLIDRDGILRSVTARGQLDALIPKLLAETPDPAKWAAVGQKASSLSTGENTSTAASVAPSPNAPAAVTAAPPASVPPAGDDAAKAGRALQLAKSYISAERFEQARAKLEGIVASYPKTPAALEAKTLLTQIEGR